MELVVSPAGIVRCVYGEDIDLHALGCPQIRRASAVEPDEQGQWWADLSPLNGLRIGPFARRGDAVAAEVAWLTAHWLLNPEQFLNLRSVNAGFCRPDRDLDSIGTYRLPGPALRASPSVVTPIPERSA
ncbi:MAG: hypothetical protein JWN40_1224 [Phycisphaerales bacterium]|nr:hypothetical protein [Phycisphaerales bacterium]